ncbi:carbohydrate kinase family protein [Amphibacillus sediminis]|uniref:carbohydrate kinase family protein n=1 Tax=Amphibacillus sediminis TaxID=360185 RepID=UPI00082D3877|nr:sugar kinase [Amphibacillus sediminis]
MKITLQSNHILEFPDKTIDVLAIGEILVDMISTDYDDVNHQFQAYFGGSPANIVMNVNRLGGTAKICAAVGDDRFGDFLTRHLTRQKMDTTLIQQVKQSTSMVVVNKSKGTPLPIFYRGADYRIQLTEELSQALKQAKIVHFSSWPISNLRSRQVIKQALMLAREAGALVCFDPNYHQSLWDDSEDGRAIMKEMIGQVDIIKPSEDDAERLFGPDTPENQIDKCHQLGCRFVIMTLGKEGAIVSDNGEKTYYHTRAEKVVDTTGAGDAFWSGFYCGITQGETVEKALEIGFLTSAYKLNFTGAVVELPHYKTLLECADK